MRRLALSAALLAALCGTSAAETYVPGFVDLAFTDAQGGMETVTFAIGLPASAVGAALCAKSLAPMLPGLQAAARKQLGDDSMVLQGVACRNVGNDWVKMVRRIPVAWTPQVQ